MKGFKGLMIFVVIAVSVRIAFRSASAKPEDRTSLEYLSKSAAEVNKSLPKRIDEVTEWTRIGAEKGLLIFTYRVNNLDAATAPKGPELAEVRRATIWKTCGAKDVRNEFLARGVAIRVDIRDRADQEVGAIMVHDYDCPFRPTR